MSNNRITCRWHQLNYRPYKPTWLRRQIFLLCGEHWRDLVVPEYASVLVPKESGLLDVVVKHDPLIKIQYTCKDWHIEEAFARVVAQNDNVFTLQFLKPIVEPMASKDVYLKVI